MPDLAEAFVRVAGPDPVMQGLLGGLAITLFNLVGALLVLVWRNPAAPATSAWRA